MSISVCSQQHKTLKEQQEDVLSNFDYIRVHKTMQALEWKWFNSVSETGVPLIGELVLHFQLLLSNACSELLRRVIRSGGTTDMNCMMSCGGFTVQANYWADDESYTIDAGFEVASWSTRD